MKCKSWALLMDGNYTWKSKSVGLGVQSHGSCQSIPRMEYDISPLWTVSSTLSTALGLDFHYLARNWIVSAGKSMLYMKSDLNRGRTESQDRTVFIFSEWPTFASLGQLKERVKGPTGGHMTHPPQRHGRGPAQAKLHKVPVTGDRCASPCLWSRLLTSCQNLLTLLFRQCCNFLSCLQLMSHKYKVSWK